MNFTYTIVEPDDQSWGSLQSDGSWNGMVKMLQEGTVDLCEKIHQKVMKTQVICYERNCYQVRPISQ